MMIVLHVQHTHDVSRFDLLPVQPTKNILIDKMSLHRNNIYMNLSPLVVDTEFKLNTYKQKICIPDSICKITHTTLELFALID